MSDRNYKRTVEDLEKLASKFWPPEFAKKESELSVIPILVQTLEDFISILRVPVVDLDAMLDILDKSTISPNLFMKHLVVLADFGGEPLRRISREHQSLFPDNSLTYQWGSDGDLEKREYKFRAFPARKFSNANLGLKYENLFIKKPITDLQRDAVAVLLFGATSTEESNAQVLAKCEISQFLGQPEKLEKFIRERYIWVSQITGGAKANSLGQLVQQFIKQHIEENLGIPGVKVTSNGHIPGIQHVDENDRRLTTFDLVIQQNQKFVAVEVSFQVTTNSVIERKSGQAKARFNQLEEKGYRISYVLDGSGNFERESALRTICQFSHCTVAFSPTELQVLCAFIVEYFGSD
jgi:hypothetical protein